MKDELYLIDYWRVVQKRKKALIGLIFLIVFVVFVVSLIIPKTYESQAIIQLGQYELTLGPVAKMEFVIEPPAAKHLLTSSRIMLPVINSFFKDSAIDLKEFNEKYLEAEIISEDLGRKDTVQTSLLRVKVKTNSREKSRNVALAVSENFVRYGNQLLDQKVKPVHWEYAQLLESITQKHASNSKLYLQDYDRSIKGLKEGIELSKNNILKIEDILSKLKSKPNLFGGELSLGLAQYETLLIAEKGKKIQAEQELRKAQEDLSLLLVIQEIDFEREVTNLNLKLEESKAKVINFEIISEPQVPLKESSPEVGLNLAIALIAGIAICFIWIVIEATL